MIHKDVGIPTVQEVICERSIEHRTKLVSHPNPLLQHLPRDDVIRRLKRRWPADLQYGQRDLLAGGDLITLVSLYVRLPASTLAYRILCTLIADLINKQKSVSSIPVDNRLKLPRQSCNTATAERTEPCGAVRSSSDLFLFVTTLLK
jgi:hypothetical protein